MQICRRTLSRRCCCVRRRPSLISTARSTRPTARSTASTTLPPEELPEVLHRLHLFVRPGGMLILDIRDPASFRALDGGTFVDETDDVLCLWRAEFDAAAQTMHYGMDLFTRAGELWSRASEEHIEYAHTPELLTRLLTEAGFLDVTVRRDGPQADAGRVFLTAMRSLEYGSETMESTNPVG